MAQYTEAPCRTFTAGEAISQYLRVYMSGGNVLVAGATDNECGTAEREAFASGDEIPVRLKNAQGTRKMIAAGAISAGASVYGAAAGKVNDVANENFQGVALEAASGDGSIIEVVTYVQADQYDNLGAIDGNVVIDEDFAGDWPAAATALSGQGAYAWTKVETNGLGVISSDQANGVIKLSADAVAEAATCSLYMVNAPFDIDDGPIVEFVAAVYDIGDDAAVDIDFGMAADTHATDFESTNNYASFHLNGNSLALLVHSDDGSTDTAETATGVTLTDDTFACFKIDFTDKTSVKFYHRALGANTWTRVASGTTFDMSNYSGTLTPIMYVEKTSNDSTFDVRFDRCRVQCPRAGV